MNNKTYLTYMKYNTLADKIKNTYWDDHYFIFYYMYSLQIDDNAKIKREIFVKVAENIGFLTNWAK
jgi:hypothetical protein